MAQSERRRTHSQELRLSEQDFKDLWDGIVTGIRRPKLARATCAWDSLGTKYAGLDPHLSSED
jgi:hypothetical protein